MSRENVEIVRRGLQAFNEGDLDRALRMCDPRVEVRTLLSGTAHGRDQVRAVILEREKEFGGVQYIPEEFIDAGDVVVGIVHVSGSGRLSGITEKDFPATEQLAFVWTLRGGLVIRQEMFSSKADALEAAGLSEYAMSEENVKLVRRAFEAFNRRDLDTMLALADEEIVVESRLAAMEGGYHGLQGVRRWWEDALDVLPDYEVEVEEVRDFGDVTVARLRARGHGAGSAAPLEEVIWNVARWRAGRSTWWRNCMTEEEALQAAGLSE